MKLNNQIGKGSGKLGGVVFAINQGAQIVREHRDTIANPNTATQVAQRGRLKLMQQLAVSFADVIAFPKRGNRSPRNLFVSRNIDSCYTYNDHVEIEYEKLQLAVGTLAFPAISAVRVGISRIDIQVTESVASFVSRVVYNVFKKSTENKFYLVSSHIVTKAGVNGTFPLSIPFLPEDVVVLAYGIRDRNNDATARFANYRAADGIDIAKLVVTRTISRNDYQFTRTSGASVYQSLDVYPYGIEFDTSNPSPTCRRLGNSESHRRLPVQSLMRGCLMDDDGTVNQYLPEDDWSNSMLDGAEGQVMVELPAYYRKFVTDGTKRQVWLSLAYQNGYEYVPKCYVSAFEATIDRDNNMLASVANLSAQYRGGNNNASWDMAVWSLLGKPATNQSLTAFRDLARNRKHDSYEWNCMTYDCQKTLYWFFVVEYATLNSQANYTAALTAEGFRQGGLGVGVSTLDNSKWTSYNERNPFINCGVTKSLGNHTGIVPYAMPAAYDTEHTLIVNVPKYRGIENPFGHIYKWADGILIQVHPDSGENVSKVYVSKDPAKFNSSSIDNYTHVGNLARNGGYIKNLIFGEGGEIMAEQIGGSASTYFCDYNYTPIPASSTELRGVRFGGNAADGSAAGFACARSSASPSSTDANIGTRLTYIPAQS